MKIIVIHKDNSISWVKSYSYTDAYCDVRSNNGKLFRVNITDDYNESFEWNKFYDDKEDIMNDIINKIKVGLMYYRTDIRNVYSTNDIVIQRYLKVKKIKNSI